MPKIINFSTKTITNYSSFKLIIKNLDQKLY